jgi:hypothetical protein
MSKKPKREIERRKEVYEEKMMGMLIESVEKIRKEPIARSIALRLYNLRNPVYLAQQATFLYVRGKNISPFKTSAPPFMATQLNFLIKTYNSVIEDLRSHLAKKDSYISDFSTIDLIDKPTVDVVTRTLSMMDTNILQILSYMTRWTE